MTKKQRALFNKVKTFVKTALAQPSSEAKLEFVNDFPARDRRFLQDLGDALHLEIAWDEADEYGQSLVVLRPAPPSHPPAQESSATNGQACSDSGEEDEWSDEEDSEPELESKLAVERVLEKYQRAKIVDDIVEDFEESYDTKLQAKLDEWKHDYYKVSFPLPSMCTTKSR
jgi:5'-3' exoribonuclease 1